jgi:hypothetical protein
MLESFGTSGHECLRIILEDRENRPDNYDRCGKQGGDGWTPCVNGTGVTRRRLVAAYHCSREILFLDQGHDDDCGDMKADHREQSPGDQFMQVFRRFATECARPDSDSSECKQEHHRNGPERIMAKVGSSATIHETRDVTGNAGGSNKVRKAAVLSPDETPYQPKYQ